MAELLNATPPLRLRSSLVCPQRAEDDLESIELLDVTAATTKNHSFRKIGEEHEAGDDDDDDVMVPLRTQPMYPSAVSPFLSQQNLVRCCAWMAFWINFYMVMDCSRSVALLFYDAKSMANVSQQVTAGARLVAFRDELAIISVFSLVLFLLACLVCGAVIELNARLSIPTRWVIIKCRLSLMLWALSEVIGIIISSIYLAAWNGFYAVQLCLLLRLLFIPVIAVRYFHLNRADTRLRIARNFWLDLAPEEETQHK